MKHKFWLVLLTILVALCLCIGIVACSDDSGNNGQNNKTEQGGDDDDDKTEQGDDDSGDDEIDENQSLDYLEFELSNTGSYYIVRGIRTQDTNKIVIPSTYNGRIVAEIGNGAFSGWQNLQSVRIPDSIYWIRESAFDYCISLTSVTIPVNVQECTLAFTNCTALKTINWNAAQCRVSSTGEFRNCASISTVVFGDEVQFIPDIFASNYGSDFGRENITSVTVGKNVNVVNSGTFQHCENLKTVYWNAKRSSQSYAPVFEDCKSLTTVVFGDEVEAVSDSMFYGCTSLTSVSNTNSIITIGEKAFYECGNLAGNINFDSATSIGAYAFSHCSNLNNVSINSVTYIRDYAFTECLNLKSVIVGNKVITIGISAFQNCQHLTNITISESVTSIGNLAFSGCDKLIEVYNLSSLNITKGSASNGYVAYYAQNVYTATEGGSKLKTENDFVFYEDGDNVYLVDYTGDSSELILPDKFNDKNYSIYTRTFANCTNLTSVTIGNGVTSIGNYAFDHCTCLETATLSDGLTSIDGDAFSFCTSLKSINIPSGVTSIGSSAFYKCTSLTEITIPQSVTSIGSSAFYNCTSLTEITIPKSVTSIGSSAFYNCTSLTIYVEVFTKPSGWASNWNSSNCPIRWGYTVN